MGAAHVEGTPWEASVLLPPRCRHLRASGRTTRTLWGWLTGGLLPESLVSPGPWGCHAPPGTELQANSKTQPRVWRRRSRAAGGGPAWEAGGVGPRGSGCPLTVLWDRIPSRSHGPISQWAALLVVMYNMTASLARSSCLEGGAGWGRVGCGAWACSGSAGLRRVGRWGAPSAQAGAGQAASKPPQLSRHSVCEGTRWEALCWVLFAS